MVLQSGVVKAREDADADKTPVREVDGRERADIVALEATNAVEAIDD